MLVTLISRRKIYKITLPQTAIGNYWISDDEGRKIVNVEGKDEKWQITSNNHVKIINPRYLKTTPQGIRIISDGSNNIINKAILKKNETYGVYLEKTDEVYVLYCSDVYEREFENLKIKNTRETIFIGSGSNNQITYNNKLVNLRHARIFFENGRWTIKNLDPSIGTFVNNNPVPAGGTILFNGDVIFIMGLKIILMGNSIFINNPKNSVRCSDSSFTIKREDRVKLLPETDDDYDKEIYSEKEYYSRAPRITNVIEREKVKIDAPPQIQNQEELPLILVIGTSLSMGVMMIISIITAIDGRLSGTATAKQTIFSLIVSIAMLISMILIPILNVKYNKKRKIKYEEKRQKKYKEYLYSKRDTINSIMNKQRSLLYENYLSAEECTSEILNRGARLWERKVEDYDFGTVRLGVGEIPLEIDISYPEERFSMDDDNLVEILNEIGKNSKTLKNAPITISLVEKEVSALIVQNEENSEKFMQSLIIQLITFQSYQDLKLVFFLSKKGAESWEYVKMLPHVWNKTNQIRFFAEDYEDMKEVSKYLEEILQQRKASGEKDYKSFMPYYLIITDDYKKIESLKIITEILKTKENFGFSIFCITKNLMQLPNECETFVVINDKTGMIFENKISSTTQRTIKFDTSNTFFFERICQTISNIPIKSTISGVMALPQSYSFLEMYDVGLIEQLNVYERWKKNDSTLTLKAPIGIDETGSNIALDLHEKFHGPHGLIAGSTGSGKSEFIITYILSLAINYHPDDVTFILIDYKGGGLAGAFQKKNIKLPHLVGTITNIDSNGLQRSLDSIQSELKRRQVIFNEARNVTDEGTIDIYKYQKLYHSGIVKEPISHLLIICDEFAELKQQQPEFMDELISVSRIGRSLGVHLILATQKPAGIISDQIRANSKFAVCLKVQEKQESMDVIKRGDAVNLRRAGEFYLQVGNDEFFVLGQSAWAGAPYFPSDITKKKISSSVEFISDIGTVIKEVDDQIQKVVSSKGDQLTNIVKYIYEIAERESIKTKNLWLEAMPENIFVKKLRKKYNVEIQQHIIEPVIGEYDDPSNQRQGIVKLDLSNGGNALIYGSAESGKETLLSTMIYDLITTYNTQDVQMYILDFGSEALKIYLGAPHVGDVVFINNTDKITKLFEMLQEEIKERKQVLADYNGDYNFYINTSGGTMPMIVVIINNYESFSEFYKEKYEEDFMNLTREGVKYGITFVVTVSTYHDVRYRTTQNFKQKIALQMNNQDDYISIFTNVKKKRPAHIFGRGLISLNNGEIYEFQTAKICEPEKYNDYIKEVKQQQLKENKIVAKSIPTLPDKVTIDDVINSFNGITKVPLGIAKKDLKIVDYNFNKNFLNIITSKNIEDAIEYTFNILELIKKSETIEVVIFDAERTLATEKDKLKNSYEIFRSKIGKKKNKQVLCVIIGIERFLSDIENGAMSLNQMLKDAEQDGNYTFIITDNYYRLKNHGYDDWYKKYTSKDDGIWVGNGVDDQFIVNINMNRREIISNCGRNFGYVVKQGKASFVKLLEMKENGDEDE